MSMVDDIPEKFVLDPRLKPDGNGKIRTFSSGATRDSDADKIEYRRHFSAPALRRYGTYMHRHRFQSDGSLREPDNWKKGIPVDAYYNSLYRHNQELAYEVETSGRLEGEVKEEMLCAIIFNAMGALHEILKVKEVK